MKKLKKTYTRAAQISLLALLVLMLAGSFADLPLSRAVYPGRESSVGQFFAAFGELPAFLLISGCGVLLFVIRTRLRKSFDKLFIAVSVFLVAAGIALAVHEASDNVPALPKAVALLVVVFSTVIGSVCLLLLSRGCQAKTVVRFICTVLFVTIGTMLLVNIIKLPWGRARMRLIVSTGNESYFTPWWKAGTALKDMLVANGVSPDEFRSFPSGHTACAACACLAILFPTLGKRFRGREWRCFAAGVLWTLLVAFTRILMGAHFLTDVTFSCLVVLGMSVLGIWLFYFNASVSRFVWRFVSGCADRPEKRTEA